MRAFVYVSVTLLARGGHFLENGGNYCSRKVTEKRKQKRALHCGWSCPFKNC